MAIPIYERQGTVRALPSVAAHYAGDGGQTALWGQAGKFVGQVQEKVEEFEDAETLESFNRFQREVEEYHNDPDKGIYNTKLGKDADGVAGSADMHIDNLMAKYGNGLKSPRARQNFARMATQERERRYSGNMKFEAGQIQAFRDKEADATMAGAMERIAASYDDDAVVAAEKERLYQALELKVRGLGPEARAEAVREVEDKIGASRVVGMIREDPFKAEAWFKENRDSFSAGMAQKVEDAIKEETDKRVVVGATDQMWEQFGEDEAAAREAIYGSDLETEQKDKVWTRYQARATDQRRFDQQAETDWYNQWYERLGQVESVEDAVAMIEQSGATGKHKLALEGIARQFFAGKGGKEAKPEDDMGAYLEAYEKIARGELRDPKNLVQEYGILLTPDTIKTLSKQIIDGTIRDEKAVVGGDSDVKNIMKNAGIKTPQAQSRFLQVYSGEVQKAQEAAKRPLTQAEKLVIAENLAKEDVVLEKNWWPDGKTHRYVDEGMRQIDAEWDPALKKYVIRDGEGKVTDIVEMKPGEDGVEFSGQPYSPTRVDREAMTPPAKETAPQEKKTFENLPPGAPNGAASTPAQPSGGGVPAFNGDTASYFVQGGGRISSPFGASEKFRKSGHKGIDIAVPRGTPVLSPTLEGFQVTQVVTGKKRTKTPGDAGNIVRMKQNVNGHDVEVAYLHLDNVDVKVGDTVAPGQQIAGVGNTGYTVGKNGYHLDVRIKVDGKYIDPAKFPAFLAENGQAMLAGQGGGPEGAA